MRILRSPGEPGRTVRRRRHRGFVAGLLIGLATLLSACSATVPGTVRDPRPMVLTTFTVLADMARVVAGNHLRVESITKPGAEIHGYEPTPGDLRDASRADLIVDNGLGLEAWFSQFVDQLDVDHVVLSDGVDPIDIAGDAYAGRPNPHAWMSPRNAEVYVDNLVDAFSELDPAHAAEYRANGERYAAEFTGLADRLRTAVDRLPQQHRVLVTCEGAFPYLARDAGLAERYVWPVNAEQQATPQRVASVITFVRDSRVPAVFCESTVPRDSIDQVIAATDADFGGVLYVDSLSEADGPVPTYLELLRHDIDLIIAGLSEART